MKRGLIVAALVAATASLTCCRGQEKIQVAFIGSVSGKLTGNTILGMNAIELYLNRPQSAESWAGYELVIFDDKSDEDNLAGIVSEIKKRGIKFVIGPFSSSFAMRARELLAGADILLVAPVAAADDLAGIDDNFIKMYPSITAAAERLAEQAAASGARKIAPIQDVSNLAFCTIWVRAFRDILAGRVEVAEPISFRNPGAIDYNRLSSSALSTGADSVLLIANTFDCAMLCQRLRISAPDVELFSSSWSFNEIFLSSTGSSSEGVVFVAAFDSESDAPGYLDYRRSYEARFMKPVNEFAAAYCYESMLVLDQSITAARSSSPAKVKAAMIAKGAFQGLQGPFTINATGDAVRDFHVIVVRNGEYRIRR